MMTRRQFLAASTTLATTPLAACVPERMHVGSPYASAIPVVEVPTSPAGILVNDLHSQLNPTTVARIVKPSSVEELRGAIALARRERRSVSIAGGRRAAGGRRWWGGVVAVGEG